MHIICNLAYKEGIAPGDWTKATTVPAYKRKGDKNKCGNHKGINLFSIPSEMYSNTVNESVQKITKDKISEEQGAFKTGSCCVDQT